ncbi:SDR family oxidoreductase [Parvularcula marina]|uniref:SDR family oxidoreductase n=1 Tax=Parvularcula marina TaxID=2292771 RepID=UPI003511C3EC
MLLTGHKALVTGASRGIGLELARGLLKRGAQVLALSRSGAPVKKLEEAYPGRVEFLPADLSRRDHVDALIGTLQSEQPDLSILINNAGVQYELDLFGKDQARVIEQARDEIEVNLTSIIELTTGLLPVLKAQPAAAIVNITSSLALAPKKSAPVYCATKAGLRSFTKTLRYQCEEKARHILVVDAMMGLVETDMTAGRGKNKITPERAASEVLDGLQKEKTEIAIAQAALLKVIARIAPGLAERILRNA